MKTALILTGVLLLGTSLFAAADMHISTGQGSYQQPQPQSGNGANAEVMVDMPPEAWTQGQNNNQPPCLRCCTYENRSYTEGSVVKMEGVLLQCGRDEKSYGTNNLIWKTIR
ncbi:YnjH family protein [Erwiniaceae bacterium CMYE1]|nr:YnjH family protein [Erwinia phyllosphaerae]